MSKWRKPGQPYTIVIDGMDVKCKPLTRGDALDLAELSTKVPEGKSAGKIESFYDKLAEQVISIGDFTEPVAEVLSYQTHDIMLDIFKGIIGGSGLSDAESKNLKPLSDGTEANGPTGDVATAGPNGAGFITK